MNLRTLCLLIAVATLAFPAAATAEDAPLAHMVFFELKEDTPDAKKKLVAACDEYLSDHEGTLHFSAGVIAEEFDREVNDRDFHVALHLIFKNKAAHDTYQDHPRHLEFIRENRESWKNVRVFDSYLKASSDKSGA